MVVAGSVAVLAEVWGELLRASGATERLMELLRMQSPIASPSTPEVASATHGGMRVRFEGVGFTYPSRPRIRCSPISRSKSSPARPSRWSARPAPARARCSSCCSGSTTSARPLTVDGVDVRALALESLRRHIAVVPQEAMIFSGSVLDNVRYGRPEASDDEARAAARAARVEEFVLRLPEDYATEVGERGLRLSGGQRQRLAIARAILKDAPLLLLDEATSALDAESERAVQSALETAMRGRTTIVIAHRLATVQRVDRIFVLDHGRIVDAGTHAELIARGGLYGRLAALQFST